MKRRPLTTVCVVFALIVSLIAGEWTTAVLFGAILLWMAEEAA